MKITKETITQLKNGDILEGFFNGVKRGEVITFSYEISDLEVKLFKLNKTQYYFKGMTKDKKADMRKKSIDVLDSALTWYKK